MLFKVHLCNHILLQSGGGTWGTALYTDRGTEVWVQGIGMSTLGAETSLYSEDRRIQVPMTLEHDNIVGTQCCDTLSHVS
jgi:hypothetical protein